MKKLLSVTTILCAISFPMAASANTAANVPSSYVEQAISRLPADKAEEFRDRMQQAHEDNQDLYNQAHQLREDLHTILTADNFDKDAFIAKSEELRQVHNKIGANLDGAFAEGVADLTPDDRMKLARAMEHEKKAHKAKAAQ